MRLQEIIHGQCPQHVAIIMDGNRRWARTRGLSSNEGHEEGIRALDKVVNHCKKRGIKTLTIYTFSTENWRRTKEEVQYLMKLIVRFLREKRDDMLKNGIRLNAIGDLTDFPRTVQRSIRRTVKMLARNDALVVNVALSYGGRREIVHAVKKILAAGVSADEINEELIQNNLYTGTQKDPELVIRTGGQKRLSNFLLWQSSYSELYFTKTLWPDFNEMELDKAILDFQSRKRNFGK